MASINTVQVSQPTQSNIIDTDLTKDTKTMSKAIKDKLFGTDSKESDISDKAKTASTIMTLLSDERLKDIFGSDDIVANFAKLNAYEFKYKPEALRLYENKNGVDEGTNIGVMAQELEKNPVTENVVTENENGHKVLDTKKLTAANSAVLSDVCKRLLNIERILGIENNDEEI